MSLFCQQPFCIVELLTETFIFSPTIEITNEFIPKRRYQAAIASGQIAVQIRTKMPQGLWHCSLAYNFCANQSLPFRA